MSSLSDGSLPISALQHWLFCPRQCALIHVERLWAENRLTAEGRVLHERADAGGHETRKGIKTLRGVQIASAALGLHGIADIVELHGRPAQPFPVEYKRGRPKPHRADEVQLCAQALCLEEMLETPVPEGALFYGQTKRRKTVLFDEKLRTLTKTVATEARAAVAAGTVPPPLYEKRKCDACSLIELCRPQRMGNAPAIGAWLVRAAASDAVPE